MKNFIDDKGTFQINIPNTWKYNLETSQGENVHTFSEYRIWKSDIFQLSIIAFEDDSSKYFFQNRIENLPIIRIGEFDFSVIPETHDDNYTFSSWVRLVDNKRIMFSLNYLNNPDDELDNLTTKERIERAYAIIKTFRLIDENVSKSVINSYRFGMFMQGFEAAALMLNNSLKNKAFIEATCLFANQIDGLLRIGIILKHQLNNKSNEIPIEWIYQGHKDRKRSEKDIYKKALDMHIIEKDVHENLCSLYSNRNRVMHRFIISEITLAEVEEIAYCYSEKAQKINRIIYDLESEQISQNVGMTTVDLKGGSVNNGIDFIKGKIGLVDYFEGHESI